MLSLPKSSKAGQILQIFHYKKIFFGIVFFSTSQCPSSADIEIQVRKLTKLINDSPYPDKPLHPVLSQQIPPNALSTSIVENVLGSLFATHANGLKASEFFRYTLQAPHLCPSADAFEKTLHILTRMRYFDKAWELIEEIKKKYPSLLTIKSMSIVLSRIARFQSFEETLAAFERMENDIYIRNKFGTEEFNILLRAFCTQRQMKEARSVFNKLHSRFSPNTKTMNILLLGFKESGDITSVELFYHDMTRRGFKPNNITYNIRIDAYCKKGSFGDALRLFEAMERENCLPTLQTITIPFIHPEITEEEIDLDWGQYKDILSEADKRRLRKQNNKLFCVAMSSTVSVEEITWSMTYYQMEGKWARPPSLMRPHIFNWPEPFKVPRMVTSPKLMALGVGAPLHPYFKSILQWYDIAPIQLSPNSYKLALALLILYDDEGITTSPTMEEFSYFFAIRKSSKGYFFLTPQHKHNKIGFSNGKVSHEKNWKEPFFYLWNVERIRVVFNLNYNNRNTKELFGEAKKRADKILALPPSRFHLKTLISEENLKRVGILKKEVGTIIPYQRFRKGVPIKGGKDFDSDEDEEESEDKSEEGMDGLPAGWGLEMGSVPAARVTKRTKTRAHRKDPKKPVAVPENLQTVTVLEKDKSRKRKEKAEAVVATEDASLKKQKTSSLSLVSASSSPLSIPFVSDDDVLKWKQRDPLEENEAIIKASSEMLISALNRQSLLKKDRARLEVLEKEKCRLSKQVEDRTQALDKLKDELLRDKSYYDHELKVQEEVIDGLGATINGLKEEINNLNSQVAGLLEDQQNGWAKEKKKIEGASFMKGFRNYASGFLAQDPDYDFSKFGDETVQWITKFKVEEAAEIKSKRVFLGLEKASPVPEEEEEDASSDGIPDHTFDDPPFADSAPAKVPEDSQVVEKLNDQTQDAS